jgi:hypothetical protein
VWDANHNIKIIAFSGTKDFSLSDKVVEFLGNKPSVVENTIEWDINKLPMYRIINLSDDSFLYNKKQLAKNKELFSVYPYFGCIEDGFLNIEEI